MLTRSHHLLAALVGTIVVFQVVPSYAESTPASLAEPTYADLAGLADSAGMVVRVQVAKIVPVESARAPGLQAGQGRFYVEAKVKSLLSGRAPIGESVKYLVDLPLDSRGKPPKLKKRDVLVFAHAVPGRAGELQLVTPGAQILWDEAVEAHLRDVLQALVSLSAPAKVTGVRELLYVPGNLAGQGETQIFLTTKDGSAASITVRHGPGAAPAWGASFSELVAEVGHPPRRDTLEWYRLACFLPQTPPAGANVSEGSAAQEQADADYRAVLNDLGPCERRLP